MAGRSWAFEGGGTMNYPIPFSNTNIAYFYANSTNKMGSFSKPVDGRVQISLDYSKLVPAVIVSKIWFEINPGGVPPLTIDSSLVVNSTLITFFVAGGYSDISYNIIVNAVLATGEIHSDLLIISVYGDDGCGCACVSTETSQINLVTGSNEVFVNKYPRFFVNNVAPTNANLLDRWYNTNTGIWYDYVTDGRTDFWVVANVNPVSGGGGTGNTGQTGNITIKRMRTLVPDGVTTTFPLVSTDSFTPNVTTSNSLFVSLDGVWQEPTVQFVGVGNTITFATAPSTDSYIFILWIYGGITSG